MIKYLVVAFVAGACGHEWAIHSVATECLASQSFYNGRDAYACGRTADNDDATGEDAAAQRRRSYTHAIEKATRTAKQIGHSANTYRGTHAHDEQE